MSTTTDHKPPGWGRILMLSIALQTAGVVAFCLVDPLRISTLATTPIEARQQDLAAEKRLRRMENEQKARREQRRLDPDQARRLHEEQVRRKTGDMQERVRDLKQWRDRAREAAEQQHKTLAARSPEDIGKHLLQQLQPHATQLVAHALNQQAMMDLPAASNVVSAAHALNEALLTAGERLLTSNHWARLKELEQHVRAHQHRFIQQLDQQQAAYPDDLPRLQAENHAEYLVNLANNTMADLMRNQDGLDLQTMNLVPTDGVAPPPPPNEPAAPSDPVSALHREALAVYEEIQRDYAMAKAVDTALQQHTSLASALAGATLPPPVIAYDPSSASSPPSTLGALHAAGQAMETAAGDVHTLWERGRNMASAAMALAGMGEGGTEGTGSSHVSTAAIAASASPSTSRSGRYADLSVLFLGGSNGEKGFSSSGSGGRDITHRSARTGFAETGFGTPGARAAVLAEPAVLQEALPGRVFDRNSPRQGWLYIDTWYIIGPWENHGNIRFAERHPPETLVDLDAEYPGKGGRTLRWQFHQSDNIRIKPPDETEQATYYGYTEVYSEETSEVLIAIATDDAAQVWLNGLLIWDEDDGNSPWRLDEGFRNVVLNKGFNTILVRIENGPITCTYSLLLCPPDVLMP